MYNSECSISNDIVNDMCNPECSISNDIVNDMCNPECSIKTIVAKNKSLPCHVDCPKCGSEDINRTYSKKDDYRNSLYDKSTFENEYIKSDGYGTLIKKECIFNHCRTCHYEWAVDVL
jgi:hypothetical protein